jgi:hypothetical protein
MQERRREPEIMRPMAPPPSANMETIARNLSDKSQDAWNAVYSQRWQTPVELYVALAGFAASTKAYWQMAADAREDANLRNSASSIVAAAAEIDSLLGGAKVQGLFPAWRMVQPHVMALSNTYNLGYTMRGRGVYQEGRRDTAMTPGAAAFSGRLRWRGQVDGSDYIMLQGGQVTIRHLEFSPITGASFELPNPLPRAPVHVNLTRLRGRGRVEIVQQPTAENDYTVTVLIEDTPAGSDFYEFELTW